MLKTFDQQRPCDWQVIKVVGDDGTQRGYYHFSGHHTYPHSLYSAPGVEAMRIECYTGKAEWEESYE